MCACLNVYTWGELEEMGDRGGNKETNTRERGNMRDEPGDSWNVL